MSRPKSGSSSRSSCELSSSRTEAAAMEKQWIWKVKGTGNLLDASSIGSKRDKGTRI